MKNFLIRLDASEKIGLGHLMRCLPLSIKMSEYNFKTTIVSRNFSDKFAGLLHSNCIELILLSKELSIDKEAKSVSQICDKLNAPFLVLDVNNRESFNTHEDYCNFVKSFENRNFKLITIEEYIPDPPESDFIVIPYVNAEKLEIEKNNNCTYLIGPDFYLLRNEFIISKKKEIQPDVINILITMGGTNPGGFTEKVLMGISMIDKPFDITVILTNASKFDFDYLNNLKRTYAGKINLIYNCENMAEQMAEADLAVINSGLTKYETLYMGLPTIVISNNSIHSDLMNDFEEETKALIHIGDGNLLSINDIYINIDRIVKNFQLRKELSEKGKKLIDGKGIERLVKIINGLN